MNKNTKFKIISVILVFPILVGVLIYAHEPKDFGAETLPALEAPKEKILNSKTISVKKCSKWVDSKIADSATSTTASPICEEYTTKDIKKYIYASETEVPQATHDGVKEDMSKRTKNAQFFKKQKLGGDGEEEWVMKAFSGQPFYEEAGKWYQIEKATTTLEAFEQAMKPSLYEKIAQYFSKSALGDTTSYYAGSGDGYLYDYESTWSAIHDASSIDNTIDDSSDTQNIARIIDWGGNKALGRGLLPFDTSGLPDGASISTATLNLYVYSKNDGYAGSYDYFAVVETFQASMSSLEGSDWEDVGYDSGNEQGGRGGYVAVEGSDQLDTGNVSTGQYNTFTLNSTGRGWINDTGYTKLGIKTGPDINEYFDDFSKDEGFSFIIYLSEYTGTGSDPYLEITYTEAPPEEPETQDIIWFK